MAEQMRVQRLRNASHLDVWELGKRRRRPRPSLKLQQSPPDFFKTFGIRLIRGRAFTEQDTASSVKVVVVNEDFVKKYLKSTDPFQQRISVEQLIPGATKLGPPVE